jgi:hypothetical protein
MNVRLYGWLAFIFVVLTGCERQPAERNLSGELAGPERSIEQPALSKPVEDKFAGDLEWKECPEQRPEVCTQHYLPVCGRVDTGIRCVTTPCPSYTFTSFGNACTACANYDVTAYTDGSCEALEADSSVE